MIARDAELVEKLGRVEFVKTRRGIGDLYGEGGIGAPGVMIVATI